MHKEISVTSKMYYFIVPPYYPYDLEDKKISPTRNFKSKCSFSWTILYSDLSKFLGSAHANFYFLEYLKNGLAENFFD